MASGCLPFRRATFPAVICEGKRMTIENKKRTLSAQIDEVSRTLSPLFNFFLLFLVESNRIAILVLVPFISLVYNTVK